MLARISAIFRGFQLLFGLTILGFSGIAISWQREKNVPAITSLCTFAGGFCVFAALLGMAVMWKHIIPEAVMSCVDAMGALLLAASGTAIIVQLGDLGCNDPPEDELINGGCKSTAEKECAYNEHMLPARCEIIACNTIFVFLGLATCAGSVMLQKLRARTKSWKPSPRPRPLRYARLPRFTPPVEKDNEGAKYELSADVEDAKYELSAESRVEDTPLQDRVIRAELEGDVGTYHELEGSTTTTVQGDPRTPESRAWSF
ncbi:hypothetical protein MBLNU230_g5564t1 [Neophaeotheca triangularis]